MNAVVYYQQTLTETTGGFYEYLTTRLTQRAVCNACYRHESSLLCSLKSCQSTSCTLYLPNKGGEILRDNALAGMKINEGLHKLCFLFLQSEMFLRPLCSNLSNTILFVHNNRSDADEIHGACNFELLLFTVYYLFISLYFQCFLQGGRFRSSALVRLDPDLIKTEKEVTI